MLRQPGDDDQLAPQPSLRHVSLLVAQATDRPRRRPRRQLWTGRNPPGVDLSAYRIAQVALTNVLKHASAGHVGLTVRCDGAAVEVTVEDDGRGPSADGSQVGGHGLIGMRERVSLFGGQFEAGPGGGWWFPRLRTPSVRANMIRVLVADDQAMVRAGLRLILEGQADIEVVGEAADGEDAQAAVRRDRPDLVLMDIRMPRLDGIAATRKLIENDPALRILIVTTFDADQYVFEALRAGASGFILKDSSPEQLVAAVRLIAAGDALLAPARTRRLIEAQVRPPASFDTSLDGTAHRSRARGARADGARPRQRSDRIQSVRQRGDGPDARRARPFQTRRALSCTGGGGRL